MELGVNPNQAATAGMRAAADAGAMIPLDGAFAQAITAAMEAAGEPEVTAGYQSFHDDWSGALREVGVHGDEVGTNTAGVAGHITNKDIDISGGYTRSAADVPQAPGILRKING